MSQDDIKLVHWGILGAESLLPAPNHSGLISYVHTSASWKNCSGLYTARSYKPRASISPGIEHPKTCAKLCLKSRGAIASPHVSAQGEKSWRMEEKTSEIKGIGLKVSSCCGLPSIKSLWLAQRALEWAPRGGYQTGSLVLSRGAGTEVPGFGWGRRAKSSPCPVGWLPLGTAVVLVCLGALARCRPLHENSCGLGWPLGLCPQRLTPSPWHKKNTRVWGSILYLLTCRLWRGSRRQQL